MKEPIIASEGHVLTNGEVYGRTIYLAEGVDAAEFHEITVEEYAAIMADDEQNNEDVMELNYMVALGNKNVSAIEKRETIEYNN